MVSNITPHAPMAYGNVAYGQGPTTVPQAQPKTTIASAHRIIEDRIDLSPAARQTLEQYQSTRKDEQDKLTDEIMTKGFQAWAQEKYRERVEAEVRSQVLSSMGLDEEGYSSLEAEVQKRIQEIIEEKVRERLRQNMAEKQQDNGSTIGAAFL